MVKKEYSKYGLHLIHFLFSGSFSKEKLFNMTEFWHLHTYMDTHMLMCTPTMQINSTQRLCPCRSLGLCCTVDLHVSTVSEEHTASTFKPEVRSVQMLISQS